MKRIKEPSTWAGLGGLLSLAAGLFPAWAGVITAAAALASAAAVTLKERAQ